MVTFDHSQRSLDKALSIPDDRCDQLDACVMFNLINQGIMVTKLFDNPDDAPVNLRTKTGLMERILDYAKNENEQAYLIWEYARIDMKMEKDKRIGQVIGGLAMLYDLVGGDEDKFISKFIEHKNKARDMFEKGKFDLDKDDDTDY